MKPHPYQRTMDDIIARGGQAARPMPKAPTPDPYHRELARVAGITLGRTDGRLLARVALDVDGDPSHELCFGRAIDALADDGRRVGTAAGADWLVRLFDFLGPGFCLFGDGVLEPVYALRDGGDLMGPIVGLEAPPWAGSHLLLRPDHDAEWAAREADAGADARRTWHLSQVYNAALDVCQLGASDAISDAMRQAVNALRAACAKVEGGKR